MNKVPKGYKYTGRYAWTKTSAEKRCKAGEKKYGYNFKVVPVKTMRTKRTGYAIMVKTNSRGKPVRRNNKKV